MAGRLRSCKASEFDEWSVRGHRKEQKFVAGGHERTVKDQFGGSGRLGTSGLRDWSKGA